MSAQAKGDPLLAIADYLLFYALKTESAILAACPLGVCAIKHEMHEIPESEDELSNVRRWSCMGSAPGTSSRSRVRFLGGGCRPPSGCLPPLIFLYYVVTPREVVSGDSSVLGCPVWGVLLLWGLLMSRGPNSRPPATCSFSTLGRRRIGRPGLAHITRQFRFRREAAGELPSGPAAVWTSIIVVPSMCCSVHGDRSRTCTVS